jgi:PEP-CTERM motif
MFLRNIKFFTVILLAIFASGNNAEAITVGGQEYTKILSFTSKDDFGYWTKGLKYFTFRGDNDVVRPNRVGVVTFRDPSLAGVNFNQVLAMGKMADKNVTHTAITEGSLTLYGDNNTVLLTAIYSSNGFLDAISRPGRAGQLDVDGVYRVTGGSLFTSGTITSDLYIDISFDNIWRNNTRDGDIRANLGTFTFYRRNGGNPPNPVPEPASMILLGSSLLGASRMRKRKQV